MLPLEDWIRHQRDMGIITEEEADKQLDELEKEREYQDTVKPDIEKETWENM